jgi:hypothetical protein
MMRSTLSNAMIGVRRVVHRQEDAGAIMITSMTIASAPKFQK